MESGCPLYETLRQHYLFSDLARPDFDSLAARITARRLDKGEVLFHRGDVARSFFFVETGIVELSLCAPTGKKKVIEVVRPGRTFAEAVAFIREHKFPVTAEALEDCQLAQIPSKGYVDILYSNPDACMRLLSSVSRHLHARVRDIEYLTVQNARGRLVSYLLDHVVDANDDKATIRLELPRHVIASRISVKPETLSRLLRTMVDEGLVTIDDRTIFVHSLSGLGPDVQAPRN